MASSAQSTPYVEGQLIGEKYRLVRCLGEGGMAAVWLAQNETLDIQVAIKFIRSDMQHAGLNTRLLQEARAAARLGHPAIVRILDFGKTEAGEPYIVMELLSGEDLGATLKRRGPMPAIKAVRTLIPIVDALAVAHSKRIVHRDLKPENIFLSEGEGGKLQPKVVDFGIAKLEKDGMERITQLGATMGSPAYMSPEQARGQDVDPRSDVWALAVVLYEITTGNLPFMGNTYTALVCAILETQPQPTTELGVGDADFWALLAKGLDKNPASRWQSMRELGVAMAQYCLARGVTSDVTGASLHSAWLERPMDSEEVSQSILSQSIMPPNMTPAHFTPLTNPSNQVAGSATGPGATQLSAATATGAPTRSRSRIPILAAAGALVLGLGGAVIYKVATRKTDAPTEIAATPPPEPVKTELPAVTVAPPPKVEATVEKPAPSEEPTVAKADPPAEKPVIHERPSSRPTSKPTAKPSTKPAEKPSEKPVAAPASTPAPSTKPPPKGDPLDIKTTL
jgi:serine/threonine-protein kinase